MVCVRCLWLGRFSGGGRNIRWRVYNVRGWRLSHKRLQALHHRVMGLAQKAGCELVKQAPNVVCGLAKERRPGRRAMRLQAHMLQRAL